MGNTYQTRGVIGNVGLPVSGGIIREEHLNNEFTNIIAAFNASTGHAHNGTDSPRVTTLGANSELGTTTTAITPGSATIDVGTSGNKFRDAFYSGTVDAAIVKTAKLVDTNGRDSIILSATSTAVNQFTAANSATGNDITLSATGSDTNVSMVLTPKGSGLVKLAKDDLAIGGTAVTTTAAELNVLDGDVTSIGTTAVAGGDGIITNDNGTMRSTSVDTFDTYLSQTTKTLTNKTLTAPVISTISNTGTLTLPTSTDTLVGRATTDTLTNKTLTTATLTTSVFSGISTTASGNLQVKPATNILEIRGDDDPNYTGVAGQIKLNCHKNSHGQIIEAQPHSAGVTNTMLLPQGSNSTLVSEIATQTLTNKTLTSPVLNTGVSGSAVKDEDDMASNSATHLATQQSIKAYVDAEVSSIQGDIEGVTAGTGLSGGGTTGTVTLNIDTSVTADLSTAQTLTNKHLGVTSEEYISLGNMGSSQALNLDADVVFVGTLNSTTCSITFTETFDNTKAYGFTLMLLQDGTGNRAATWPSSIRWADGGQAPALSSTASRYDVFTFITYDAGANYHGFHAATNQY